jgi:hypothetical protein
MKNFDIAIYGHLSYDNIYEGFNYKTSVGCMGNVWNQLKIINPDLKVKLEPTDIGESLILADVEQCKRTSISRLNLKTRYPCIHDARISHVMYINELSDPSFIKDLKGYITADVCNGKPIRTDLEALKYINLLLISDEDIDSSLELTTLINSVKDYVVLHSSTGSTIYCKNGWQHTSKAEHIPNINVLGAGDKFASYVLTGLDNSRSIDKVIQEAHNKLTEYFKNEKI